MSTETKWTPGPWEWDDCVWDYDTNEQAPWLVQKGSGLPVLRGEIRCARASANLIAAAPELYDACLDLLAWHDALADPQWHGSPSQTKAIAAIAKARGEQP